MTGEYNVLLLVPPHLQLTPLISEVPEIHAERVDARQGRYREAFLRYGLETALTLPEWPLSEVLIADGLQRIAYDEAFILLDAP